MDSLMGDYTRALCRELEQVGEAALSRAKGDHRVQVHTIFFGGGTPSLLPLSALQQILTTVRNHFILSGDVEITLEANPGTVSLDYLRGLRALSVNRLSMGMQSADPGDLRILEREHDFFDVVNAVKWARQAGFENLNLDLIFGLPYQSLESWQHTLDLAVGLQPDHLSIYSLILEHGTPMNAWVERGLLPIPEDDLAASMYEWAIVRLPKAGYDQYEISNWARRDTRGQVMACRHNLQYWLNQPYLGLGAGAHGYAEGVRTANVRAPKAYIERCLNWNAEQREFPRTPATVNVTPIDRMTEMQETMMVGLRLVETGVHVQEFEMRFGEKMEVVFEKELRELVGTGVLERVKDHIRLTERGKMVGNQVFMQFV
jgi:oxygen-independent coproporphyrinogen III oxidase